MPNLPSNKVVDSEGSSRSYVSVDPAGNLMLALQLSFSTIEDLKLHFAAAAEANNLLYVRRQAVAAMQDAGGGGGVGGGESEVGGATPPPTNIEGGQSPPIVFQEPSNIVAGFKSFSTQSQPDDASEAAALQLERFERAVQDESAVLGALAGGKSPSAELLTLRKVVKEAGMQRRKSSVSNPLLIESSARRLSKRCSKIGLPFASPPSDSPDDVSPVGGGAATASSTTTTVAQRKLRLQLQHSHLPYPMRSLHFIDEDSFVACILDYFHIVKEALEEHLLLEG